MVTLYDVPADEFIDELADQLRDQLEVPEWATFAKTGSNREFPPESDDFWYVRAASILRKVAIDGPVGVDRLATAYGGAKQGSTRYRFAPARRGDASKKLIRTVLQQLEDAGLVERPPNDKGRVVTPEGQSLLDTTASDVLDALDRPDLERYA